MSAAVLLTLAGVSVAAVIDLHHLRTRMAAQSWVAMIDRIAVAIRDGHGSAVAVLGTALHGPPPLRVAARRAVALWRRCGSPDAGVRALRRSVRDPHLDHICLTLAAVEALDGDREHALARLRSHASRDATRCRQRAWHVAVVRAAAWVGVAPVLMLATGRADASAGAVAVIACTSAWAATLALSWTSRPNVVAIMARADPDAAAVGHHAHSRRVGARR